MLAEIQWTPWQVITLIAMVFVFIAVLEHGWPWQR